MNATRGQRPDSRDRIHEPICVKETRVCWIEFGASLACLLLGLILVFAGVSSDSSAVGPGGDSRTSKPTSAQAVTYTGVSLLIVGAILLVVFGVHFYRVKSGLDAAKAERFAQLGIRPTSRYEALPSQQELPPASLQTAPPPTRPPPMPFTTRQQRQAHVQSQPPSISSRLQPMPSYQEGAFCNLGFLGDEGEARSGRGEPPARVSYGGGTAPVPGLPKGGSGGPARRGSAQNGAALTDSTRRELPSMHEEPPPDLHVPRRNPGQYQTPTAAPMARDRQGQYEAGRGPAGFSRGAKGGSDAPPAGAATAGTATAADRGVKSSRSYHAGLSGNATVLPASTSGQDLFTRATPPDVHRPPARPPSSQQQQEAWQRTPLATPPWERSPPPQYRKDPFPLLHQSRAAGNAMAGEPPGHMEASVARHSGYKSSQI